VIGGGDASDIAGLVGNHKRLRRQQMNPATSASQRRPWNQKKTCQGSKDGTLGSEDKETSFWTRIQVHGGQLTNFEELPCLEILVNCLSGSSGGWRAGSKKRSIPERGEEIPFAPGGDLSVSLPFSKCVALWALRGARVEM